MSDDTAPETPPPAPATPPKAQLPAPKPAALALATLLTLGLFLNIYLDSQNSAYDGKYATPVIALLIAGVLGFDLSKFWRGGGS